MSEQVIKQREDFFATLEHLKGKKEEYHQIKQKREKKMLDEEREQKNIQKFKFGKMKKKDPFMNAVQTIGYFQKETEAVQKHEPARDYREREALIFPDRIKNHTKKWEYQGHRSDYLKKMPGREIDQFDQDKVKFFNQPARPLGSTLVTVSKKNPDGTITKEQQYAKWHATKHKLEELEYIPPMIDNTLTPRGRTKAISLERNYEKHKKWVPNTFSLNLFTKDKEVFKSK
jgi:hypothetical protein